MTDRETMAIDHHEDEGAKVGDDRLRVEIGDRGATIIRQRYGLIRFESPGIDDVEQTTRYFAWHQDESFDLHTEDEAESLIRQLEDEELFDPQIMFRESFYAVCQEARADAE